MKLSGKHIFVTGGASGIGQAIVRDATAEGASVSFVDINKAAGEQLANELLAAGLMFYLLRQMWLILINYQMLLPRR
jgi:NAD(P)-dependent dehydrogenase (short-subunit alcohol dehydrogenase family)